MLHVPEVIRQCSGIIIFGKRIKSIAFTTDLSIVRNVNSDAIIAVYPFTPQPIITDALLMASDKPIFAGIGGGLTTGPRVVALGINAEMQGAMGVVMNSPTKNEVLKMVADALDIPAIITVVNAEDDFHLRIEAGADIFNVAAVTNTAAFVRRIRKSYPDFPIIATGGPSDETIIEAIEAGANAISWTPPPASTLFKETMNAYRNNLPNPHANDLQGAEK
ncbi:MAG: hydrolase [Oscillospiraceae bacterium]